ncbi:MAG: protein-L-isoaspartate(D-aspartate) O-methyltransferase [Pseudomonadota bacterium]
MDNRHNNRRNNRPDPYTVARRRMVTEQLVPGGIKDSRVLEVMGMIPRHEFVSPGMEDQAYLDRPLPIGFGQTISQPLMVAIMTEAMALKGDERVLEIGTGSGYQAAILALLSKEVYTIERIKDLSIRARKILYKLGYKNIKHRIGDGTLGWPEQAPFDSITVTAGAPYVPEALQQQLSDGGRLVIPVGGEAIQQLDVITRKGNEFHTRSVTACRFVKLVGKEGWR